MNTASQILLNKMRSAKHEFKLRGRITTNAATKASPAFQNKMRTEIMAGRISRNSFLNKNGKTLTINQLEKGFMNLCVAGERLKNGINKSFKNKAERYAYYQTWYRAKQNEVAQYFVAFY